VPEHDLRALRNRLRDTRWPQPWPTVPWAAGTDIRELRRLVDYWVDGFDWRAAEAEINALPSNTLNVDGQQVHYLRFDASERTAPWLLLTNGWPSTFYELVGLARRLAQPKAFGVGGVPEFTVIVPSLPGFTFSDQPDSSPPRMPTHELWHRLMAALGATRFFAHGGDLGSGITSRLAAAHPEAVQGIHILSVGVPQAVDAATLTTDERAHMVRVAAWHEAEGSYMHQHHTRPMTLAFALSDSPVGLLSWILEKYRGWSDRRFSSRPIEDDFLLTQASLYWFTNTIGTSLRPYYDVYPPHDYVTVPTALALFPADLQHPPREWAERTHNLQRYTVFERGGHFAAIEATEDLANDVRAFFALL
jgi:pimeloyl-ACP methyl ester carboxylesterase